MKFSADEKYQQPLISILVYIQTHLGDDLPLDELARRAGFSPYHFHRIFTEFVGEPVKEHIRRLRLERGAYRRKISQDLVLQIALEAGFKTHESFTRAFARKFGVNPSQFRQDFLKAAQERKKRRGGAAQARGAPALRGDPGLLPNGATAARTRLEHVKPILVAFIRNTGPYDGVLEPGSKLASLWDELFRWGSARGLTRPDSLLIGVAQDDPSVTPPARQRFDVCVQVPEFRDPAGAIGGQTIAPGAYAAGRHYGSFESLADTYAHIYDTQIAPGQYQMRPLPAFEIYGSTRVKEDLNIHYTDVYLPVEPVKDQPK
jgi:AraC family transcriptional regulator